MAENNVSALSVVLNVSVNDVMDENEKLKKEVEFYKSVLEEIHDESHKYSEKYCDLVWLARTHNLEDPNGPNYKDTKELADKHKEDFEKLSSDAGDWHHGFNSGILALSRLFGDLSDMDPPDSYYDEDEEGDVLIEPKKTMSIQERRKNWKECGGMFGYDGFPHLDT